MTRPLTPDELADWARALITPRALLEWAALLTCAIVAWLLVRWSRGGNKLQRSIWFGDRGVDGVLFPVLLLLGALLARLWLKVVLPVGPLPVFKLMLPLLWSLLGIRTMVRVLRVAFPESALVRVAERTLSWLVWVGVALWVAGILPMLLEELDSISLKLGTSHITLRNVIEGTLSAVLVLVIALWVAAAIEARLLKNATENLSLRKIAANISKAVLLFLGLLLALEAAGIDLTALGVLGGAVGVGVGFGLQKLAANYVSGFVILAERSLRIGDTVKVDGFEGRITDIKTRYTVIRALNGRESIVPNEVLITQRVENSSLADAKVLVNTVVQVAYGTDLGLLMPLLVSAVKDVPRVLADPEPSVQLSQFAADGLELTVVFWINDPENGTGGVRSAVNLAILDTLNRQGVQIPYPNRVVHQATP